MPIKDPLINAKSAPISIKSTFKILNYQYLMLYSYIKVAHELKYIT